MNVRIPSLLVFCAAIVLIASCSEKPNYDYTPVHKSFSSDPYNATLTKSQYFEINADQDNVIEGEQGIIISIPKGAFYKEGNEKVSGTVKVELTEALHLSDMIFSNLTTMSDGNLLSTGGMFYVNFTQNDQQLVIDKEVPLYVQVPK
ncbi:MAG: hypothetical protein K1X56_10855, partial [Flavobacteriales bacterium]|nr:hypothetical protein [Flavobacteriales bacterium]